MKRTLCVAAILVSVASMAAGSTGYIAVSSTSPDQCILYDTVALVAVYIFHNDTDGATGSQFRVELSGDFGWSYAGFEPAPGVTYVGDPLAGAAYNYGGCQVDGFLIGTLYYLRSGLSGPCEYVQVLADPVAPSGAIVVADCSVPPNEMNASGGVMFINPTPDCDHPCTPTCDVAPTVLDFGEVALNQAKYMSFTIKNPVGGTVGGTVSESCDYYSIDSGDGPFSLVLEESLEVSVRFEPVLEGTFACAISLGSPYCGEVSCTGVGVPRTTWYVDLANVSGPWDGSPARPFQFVAEAYAAAAAGDSIIIHAGVYSENIIMTKQLRIESEGGVVRIGGP